MQTKVLAAAMLAAQVFAETTIDTPGADLIDDLHDDAQDALDDATGWF